MPEATSRSLVFLVLDASRSTLNASVRLHLPWAIIAPVARSMTVRDRTAEFRPSLASWSLSIRRASRRLLDAWATKARAAAMPWASNAAGSSE